MERNGNADESSARMDVSRWSDRASRETLQHLVDSVTEMVGFDVAVINVIHAETMTTVTVSGNRPEVVARLLGARTPASLIRAEIERAEPWGRFRFVPEERVQIDVPAWGWRPNSGSLDRPDAWRPDDLMFAPLHSEDGELIGLLSTDVPLDGLRPGPSKRYLLDRYAEQSERALRGALYRDRVAKQVRLVDTARRLVRVASGQPTLDLVIEQSRAPLAEGFVSIGSMIHVFDVHGLERGTALLTDGSSLEIPATLLEIAARAASRLWADQTAAITGEGYDLHPVITEEEHATVHGFLAEFALASIMFVPLGAGQDTFGILILGRLSTDPYWTPIEATGAMEIGRDLGAAILNARAFEKERQLIEELKSLDTYKSQLIATVSHELKSPLTAIMAHLELLSMTEGVPAGTEDSVAAMARGALRLTGLVNDLLILARVDAQAHRPVEDVDLGEVASRVVDQADADTPAVSVRLIARAGVTVQGNPTELERVVSALLDNAIRYGAKVVSVAIEILDSQAVLRVRDNGVGISETDLSKVFDEFFRAHDPASGGRPGTGLGLSIASRIAEQHGGSLAVSSVSGEGSTFSLTLPLKRRSGLEPVGATSL